MPPVGARKRLQGPGNPETRNPKPETRNPKHETRTRNTKHETRNTKHETIAKHETRNTKGRVRGWELGVGGWGSRGLGVQVNPTTLLPTVQSLYEKEPEVFPFKPVGDVLPLAAPKPFAPHFNNPPHILEPLGHCLQGFSAPLGTLSLHPCPADRRHPCVSRERQELGGERASGLQAERTLRREGEEGDAAGGAAAKVHRL